MTERQDHAKRARQDPGGSLSGLLGQIRENASASLGHQPRPSIGLSHRATGEDVAGDDGFKGCAWSPDGTCLLTAKGNTLGVYEQHGDTLRSALCAREAENVYDYAWYPLMKSTDPATCAFISISRGTPIHLWDAFQNNLIRASYTIENEVELTSWGVSLALSETSVVAGLNSGLCFWDLTRPGRPMSWFRPPGLEGVVSAIRFDNSSNLLCTGTYRGNVLMFEAGVRSIPVFSAQIERGAGVSQLCISPCGNRLFAGSRHGRFITCWDVRFNRGSDEPLIRIPRQCSTYQRLGFDLFKHPDSDHMILATGSSSSSRLDCFDVDLGVPLAIDGFSDDGAIVNGVSYCPETRLFALATGSRPPRNQKAWWDEASTDEDDADASATTDIHRNGRLLTAELCA